MRRVPGRVLSVMVLVFCLLSLPASVASASPWSLVGPGDGFFAKVELLMARVMVRLEGWRVAADRQPEARVLKEGATADPNGST